MNRGMAFGTMLGLLASEAVAQEGKLHTEVLDRSSSCAVTLPGREVSPNVGELLCVTADGKVLNAQGEVIVDLYSQNNDLGITIRKPLEQAGDVSIAGQIIPYRPKLEAVVGDEVVIHGKKGKCDQMPPSKEVVQETLDEIELVTGSLSTGALGYRYSVKCEGYTPALGVVYSAEQAGTDVFELYGNRMEITVSEE